MNNMAQLMFLIFLSCLALHTAADAVNAQCSDAARDECVSKLQDTEGFPEFPFGLTLDELNNTCNNLKTGFTCFENYAMNCLNNSGRDDVLSPNMKSVRDLVNELCNPGPYRTDFLKHYECLKPTVAGVKTCFVQYNQTLNALRDRQSNNNDELNDQEYTKNICCYYQNYLSCVEQAANTCGASASSFIAGFVNRSTGVTMAFVCS